MKAALTQNELWNFRGKTSDQLIPPRKPQFLHHLAHILRVIAMRNQQRILGIHNDQVLHAHQRHKLFRAVDVVVAGLNGQVPSDSATLPSPSPRSRVSIWYS